MATTKSAPTVEKAFVRVTDKRTGHEFDVRREAAGDENYDLVKDYPDSWHARAPKPATPKTSSKTSSESAAS